MSEIRVNSLGNETNTGGPVLSGITTFSGQQYFIPPTGTTAQRPSACPPGSIRFNTDSAHLEYWNGLVWLEFEASSVELGNQTLAADRSAQGTGVRGLTGGGYNPGKREEIDYFTISTLGNAQDFGNLSEARYWTSSHASSTRGVWGGGAVSPTSPNKTDRIDYVTIASTGDAIDFGNLDSSRYGLGSCSNQTRGLFAGGYQPPGSQISNVDYITIASQGFNAQDFGDLTFARYYMSATASSTRGLFLSGRSGTDPYTYYDTIDYVTISSQGNVQDFGNLLASVSSGQAASNPTRGIYAGNENTPINTIQFITIATTGNAQDFGDLTANQQQGSATASSTRGIISGGYVSAYVDTIQFVTIATTGNATDFGNLTAAAGNNGSCSNGHGGL
jgi:hypothetical protein